MIIKELTELYGEQFYALELISNKNCKPLKPFKYEGDTNTLNVISFRVIYNKKNKHFVMQIVIDFFEYNNLKKWLKKENLY